MTVAEEAPPETRDRIAIVEDEHDLRNSVAEYLTLQGFDVVQATDAQSFQTVLHDNAIDIVLLDLRLPGEDGLSILRGLRQGSDLPVIMVTAMGDPVDRIIGLEVGADDYIAKPFEFRELLARIRSVLRRTKDSPAAPTDPVAEKITVGRAVFDPDARMLSYEDEADTLLSKMEFDLLKALVSRPNRVLTRDQLLDLAHEEDWVPFDRSIDIRIARLRKKVEHTPSSPRTIRTVRGAGYMFTP